MAENSMVSDEKGPFSPTISGTTAASDSKYDLEGACQKPGRDCSYWRSWRKRRSLPDKAAPKVKRSLTNSLEQSPKGYPLVANFQSSDRNFLHYRGFFNLHSRLLSDLQFDIERLERELGRLDKYDADSSDQLRQLCLQCKDHDRAESNFEEMPDDFKEEFTRTRPDLLSELHTKLMKYDEALLKSKEVHALQRPSNRDHRSVLRWFDAKKPLVAEEFEYILKKEDLVTLRTGRECGGFDGLIEQGLSAADRFFEKCNCHIIKTLFVSPELFDKTSDKQIHYYSPARVDMLVNIIITIVIFVLLIIPVVVLYQMSSGTSPFEAIGILIIFTLLFGTAMSSLTTATRQELFAASAAYCAVLVVFIGNFTNQDVTVQGGHLNVLTILQHS